jgi:hypothetical protein
VNFDIIVTDEISLVLCLQENPVDEDAQIVEKIMSSRIVKRKINVKVC